ncbi:unnamed protein product [Linum trigynum]|uniref:Uncharacterized protein n=1 Tax=Linum trigynum TaxID=586398 RepID=A0AAV2DYM0_9ROSI
MWVCYQRFFRSCPHHGFAQEQGADIFGKALDLNNTILANQASEGDVSQMNAPRAIEHYASMTAKSQNWSRRTASTIVKMVQGLDDSLSNIFEGIATIAKEVQALKMSRNTLATQLFVCERWGNG